MNLLASLKGNLKQKQTKLLEIGELRKEKLMVNLKFLWKNWLRKKKSGPDTTLKIKEKKMKWNMQSNSKTFHFPKKEV